MNFDNVWSIDNYSIMRLNIHVMHNNNNNKSIFLLGESATMVKKICSNAFLESESCLAVRHTIFLDLPLLSIGIFFLSSTTVLDSLQISVRQDSIIFSIMRIIPAFSELFHL
jgi:hypothetical protein